MELEETLKRFKRNHEDPVDKLAHTSRRMKDTYSNSLLGLGKSDMRKKYGSWDLSNDANNWPLWLAMYNDSWVFRKAIDKPSQDVVNLELSYSSVKDFSKLDLIKKDLNTFKTSLIQLLMWGALFGGSVGIMLFDNVPLDKMHMPLTEAQIKKSKSIKLHIVDRWNGISPSMSDVVDDVSSDDFLKPKFYNIKIGKVNYNIHYSYVLRYEHRVAPNMLKYGELQGWGYPEGVHLMTELMRDEKLRSSILSLIDKSLIEVIKMRGMRSIFMGNDEQSQKQLDKRLSTINYSRTFNSVTFLDTEDEYQQNEFGGLTGLSDLMDKNMETIAAALDMTGVLYGDMSGGFSPDNYALVRYDTTIRNRAEAYYRPILKKLLHILSIKHDLQEHVDFSFDTMIQVREDKLERAEKYLGILSSMINDGLMSVGQAASEFMGKSKEFGIGTSITEKSIQKLESEELEQREDYQEDDEDQDQE